MLGQFETERMTVTPWRSSEDDDTVPSDPKFLEELASILERNVTAFLPPSLLFERGTTDPAAWAQTFGSKGNKLSSVRLKQPPLALAGLLMLRPETKDTMHIGYIFGKAFWAKGLATELNRGLVEHMISRQYQGTLVGGVVKDNPASVAVLKKCGFELDPDANDEEVDFFRRDFSS